ncbi:DNA polymerase III subunit chi [Spiribacter halobius]|uniref:DNA polymerase III subunit chi n=1 Tax=Sediminicurvatus halobius TaxID=2182432 RepID=A0A2U2N124_9GAMM|nr:DNA polymerase III subunit chi [Spiribacter halobius]PWG62810.1 DNA polymerase III subunit chi [Spiribacter halobius]UEX77042.1 DNA polymerase III subunit chi [Spiribacter halobius]
MQVDFYVLPEAGDAARELFCCRLAEKAWRRGVSVFVRTADEAGAERLDQRLWTFRPGSFVPHARAAEADGEPVLIGAEPPGSGELLINLGTDVPGGWQRWSRVAEVLSSDADTRRRGRERFRTYRDAGTAPNTHNL